MKKSLGQKAATNGICAVLPTNELRKQDAAMQQISLRPAGWLPLEASVTRHTWTSTAMPTVVQNTQELAHDFRTSESSGFDGTVEDTAILLRLEPETSGLDVTREDAAIPFRSNVTVECSSTSTFFEWEPGRP
jgi:hypothetical protein